MNLFVLDHVTDGDGYSGIIIEKSKDNTNRANLVYNANTGYLTVPYNDRV